MVTAALQAHYFLFFSNIVLLFFVLQSITLGKFKHNLIGQFGIPWVYYIRAESGMPMITEKLSHYLVYYSHKHYLY